MYAGSGEDSAVGKYIGVKQSFGLSSTVAGWKIKMGSMNSKVWTNENAVYFIYFSVLSKTDKHAKSWKMTEI